MEEDFVGMDGDDTGAPSLSAADIARAAAAEAIGRTSAPGERFTERLDSEERMVLQFDQGEPGHEGAEDIIETVDDLSPLGEEELSALRDYGYELPAIPQDAPPEIQDSFTRIAQSVLERARDAETRLQEAQTQAQLLQEAQKDIRARLTTPEGQRRLLLTLAMTNPELFEQARGQVERMSSDPEYADVVRRGLEAEARLEAAQRIERAHLATQVQTKGRQVEDRTVRLAKRLGVDEGIAKEMVAARILQNAAVNNGRRDISFQEVDEIVSNLGKRMGGAKPPAKAPAKQQQAARAPQKPAAPAGRTRTPTPPEPPARQPASSDPMDALRGAIRSSAKNLRGKGI